MLSVLFQLQRVPIIQGISCAVNQLLFFDDSFLTLMWHADNFFLYCWKYDHVITPKNNTWIIYREFLKNLLVELLSFLYIFVMNCCIVASARLAWTISSVATARGISDHMISLVTSSNGITFNADCVVWWG